MVGTTFFSSFFCLCPLILKLSWILSICFKKIICKYSSCVSGGGEGGQGLNDLSASFFFQRLRWLTFLYTTTLIAFSWPRHDSLFYHGKLPRTIYTYSYTTRQFSHFNFSRKLFHGISVILFKYSGHRAIIATYTYYIHQQHNLISFICTFPIRKYTALSFGTLSRTTSSSRRASSYFSMDMRTWARWKDAWKMTTEQRGAYSTENLMLVFTDIFKDLEPILPWEDSFAVLLVLREPGSYFHGAYARLA